MTTVTLPDPDAEATPTQPLKVDQGEDREKDSADESDESCEEKTSGFQWWHLAGVIGLLAAAGLAFWLLPVTDWLRAAIEWVDSLGWVAYVAFIGLYIPATILGAPATPLNIGSGLIFGVVKGAAVSTIGAVGGGVISFLLARYLLGDWVQKKIECYPTCDELLERCEKEPWKFLLMLRAHPLLPSALKNYSLGTTEVKLWIFAVATLVACMPTRIVYAYLGSAGHVGLSGGDGDEGMSATDWWLYGAGFAVAVLLTVGLTWFVKRKLAKVNGE
jgi:uncharacterized membrane protein YdjX (TVP38/TMEM64 family)